MSSSIVHRHWRFDQCPLCAVGYNWISATSRSLQGWQRIYAPNRRIFTYVRPFRSDLVRLVTDSDGVSGGA